VNRNLASLTVPAASGLGSLPPWVRLIDGDGIGQGAPPVPTPPPTAPQGQPQNPPVPTPPPDPQRQPPAQQGQQNSPNGYPENTPLAEMTSEQRERYWQFHARKHEGRANAALAENAALKPKADQFDALEEASRTEAEKAVTAAEQRGRDAGRTEAEAAAVAKYGAALVQARFESVLAGRLTPEQVSTLVGGLNVSAFLADDGLPDTAKITDYAAAIPAPAAPQTPPPTPPRDLGGGRTTPPPATGTAAGRALYEERTKKRTA